MQHDPIAIALAEDLGDGDVTAEYFVSDSARTRARIFAKQSCVLAGVGIAAEVFARLDRRISVRAVRVDGSALAPGDTVVELEGPTRPILSGERVALNFVQRLSGVATLTRRFVEAVAGTRAKILDTRKTTPGLRVLEKAAVLAGGGHNHRMGLYDMVMVKDNHLLAEHRLPELRDAIRRVRESHPTIRIELEADSLAQVRGFLELEGIEVILLDNMPPAEMAEAVRLGAGRVKFEASGGVTLTSVAEIAATGVDFISVGALTHSAPAIDFSLELFGA